MNKEKVSVVIPAYNEEKQIECIIHAVKKSPLVDEIIVVDDGSLDKTSEIARNLGVKVITKENGGKSSAMERGIKESVGEIIVFLDADLINLSCEHLESLIIPFSSDKKLAMTLGKFVETGSLFTYFGQEIFPYLSGQRGIRRNYFKDFTNMSEKGFGIEIAIYKYVKKNQYRFIFVPLRGLRYVFKEQKDGILKGIAYRTRMYIDIFKELMRK